MDRTKELIEILEKLGEATAELQVMGFHSQAATIQMQIINLRKFFEQ